MIAPLRPMAMFVLPPIIKSAAIQRPANFPVTPGTILSAVGVALLSGIVMSGIPGGGFLGETLIVALYGFPPEALPIISMLGTLVDPPATMVNATGDTVAGMLVAKMTGTQSIQDSS